MHASFFTLLAVPALALAQATTTSAPTAAIATNSLSPGAAARASCSSGDAYCINTANGWNSAAAQYLADERSTDTAWPRFSSDLIAAAQKVGSTGSLAAEFAKATNGPEGFAALQLHNTLVAESDRPAATSIFAKALSLQTAGVAQSTGAAGRNGTSPSPTGGVGAAGANPSNIAQTNAAARPADVAFMAMGAAVAGIAGIAYGL